MAMGYRKVTFYFYSGTGNFRRVAVLMGEFVRDLVRREKWNLRT